MFPLAMFSSIVDGVAEERLLSRPPAMPDDFNGRVCRVVERHQRRHRRNLHDDLVDDLKKWIVQQNVNFIQFKVLAKITILKQTIT
jgi:hypothetical protein